MTDRPPPARRYPTRVDWWLGALLIAVPLVTVASAALLIDRLALALGGPIPTTISPADRDGFLADLAARLPLLRRDGGALVSRTS